MNTNDSNVLIDEREIRAALSFIHIDRDAFGRGVHQRVKQAVDRPVNPEAAGLNDRGNLLRIAASVLPINLFGVKTTGATTSLAAMGAAQKAVALLALPAVSFLMIVVTIGSWFKIRGAQRSQSLPEADLDQIQKSLSGWWKRYGWIAIIVYMLALVMPFFGWTAPLLLLIIGSSITTASIVATLGRAGLIDRNIVGGYCINMLMFLGSLSMTFAMTNNTQLLDPTLVPATFFAGVAILTLFVNPIALPAIDSKKQMGSRSTLLIVSGVLCLLAMIPMSFLLSKNLLIAVALAALVLSGILYWTSKDWSVARIVVCGPLLILIVCMVAFFGQKLWRPIDTSALVQYAETFDPELAGQWRYWQATARWLEDKGTDFDHSAVQTRWLEAMNEDQAYRTNMLRHGVGTGLTLRSELETENFIERKQRLLSIDSANTQISGIEFDEYIIVALVEEGTLTDEQKDHLASRLMATWRPLNDDRLQKPLETAAIITDLLTLIDRPLAQAERKADVARWLAEYQVVESGPFARSGGFKLFSTMNNSDLMATESAVRLMEYYGTHDGVDILALRTFLRASSKDRLLMNEGCVRAATRQRLDQIPGISQPSLWDYVRLNQSLWFAVLLVGLCIYTTVGSPQILQEQ